MGTNFIIAQIFGVLSIICSVCSMQFKKRKHIFIALLLLSVFAALNLIFLDSFSSAYITIFGIVEMLINSLFERKKKSVPKLVIAFYVIVNIALGALNFTGWLDILPIACALVFCATLLTKNEQTIRKEMLLNQILWLVFDFSVCAYMLVVSNILTIISTSIAIYRFSKTRAEKSATPKNISKSKATKKSSKKN
ncbi:YgjV family protein [Candidatus Saccharibacteria bacterium]|nr:YgjV family protein [Candidatus Saccharibacteria bacterium]